MTINDLTLKVQKELAQGTQYEIGDTIYLIADGNTFRLDKQCAQSISSIELLFIPITYTLDELKQLIISAIDRCELSM